MATLDLALSLALTSLVVELTPGPNMAWLALLAATEGRARGFAAVAGVTLGLGVMGIAASLGMAAVLASQPLAYQALRWAGFVYLLYLAWEAWSGADQEKAGRLGQSDWRYFRQGLITNLLNPKAAVFFVAILPGFLPPSATSLTTVGFSGIYVGIASVIHAAIVAAAGAARGVLSDPARLTLARRIMALALVAVALWLFWRS